MSKKHDNEEMFIQRNENEDEQEGDDGDITHDPEYSKIMGKYGHAQTLDEPISDTLVIFFYLLILFETKIN